jgi:hypothetical protein
MTATLASTIQWRADVSSTARLYYSPWCNRRRCVHIDTDTGRRTYQNASSGVTRDPRQSGVHRTPESWGVKGADMGDRGGKKDKDKNKKQETKKHQEEAQRKQDNKARPKQ